MLPWQKMKRRKTKYSVCWDGELDVCFPDCEGRMNVKVTCFSGVSGLILSKRIFFKNHHLMANAKKPRLFLSIDSPAGKVQSRIAIQWYRYCSQRNMFEIGIQFINILNENKKVVDQIIDRIEYYHR